MRVVHANIFSKFFKASALVLMLSGAYAGSYAAPASQGIINGGPIVGKTEVSHLYSDKEWLLFEVKVNNVQGEKFFIIVKDENGSTLYRNAFTDKEFTRRFRIPKGESDKIVFNIVTKSGNTSEAFEINTSTKVIEEVVVKKVM